MRGYSENWSVNHRLSTSSSSHYVEIDKFGELLNKDLLTQKEFDAKKKLIHNLHLDLYCPCFAQVLGLIWGI